MVGQVNEVEKSCPDFKAYNHAKKFANAKKKKSIFKDISYKKHISNLR